jgi:hypothetical protein
MDRRRFLKASISTAFCFPLGCIGNEGASGGEAIWDRDKVVGKLRGRIKKLLHRVEKRTGLRVEFRGGGSGHVVVAQYRFELPDRPIVYIRGDWEDVDVAHELMHMKLELVDGYSVLAWRKNVERDKDVEKAFGLIRTYTDDILVFERLVRMGLKVDGEVVKRQLFEDICTNVPRYLREGRSLRNDGMAHFDDIADGRYGDLRRSTFLVQAELVKEAYGGKLSDVHGRALKDFISTFRRFRPEQAEKADRVLGFFGMHKIKEVEGHAAILREWARLEGLDKWVGLSKYCRGNGGYLLAFPEEYEK